MGILNNYPVRSRVFLTILGKEYDARRNHLYLAGG